MYEPPRLLMGMLDSSWLVHFHWPGGHRWSSMLLEQVMQPILLLCSDIWPFCGHSGCSDISYCTWSNHNHPPSKPHHASFCTCQRDFGPDGPSIDNQKAWASYMSPMIPKTEPDSSSSQSPDQSPAHKSDLSYPPKYFSWTCSETPICYSLKYHGIWPSLSTRPPYITEPTKWCYGARWGSSLQTQ